jgi:DNA replication and repair protein RecF
VDHWRRYQRALRQRNAALKAGQALALIQAWDPELLEAGQMVADHRDRYVERLRGAVSSTGQRLLGLDIDLALSRGWSAERSFQESLEASYARDRERGLTHSGPHRADIAVRVDGYPARDRVSRGQQKLVAAAMLLGQLQSDAEQGSGVAALLVDDPAAELDSESLDRLLTEVLALPSQLFITALEPSNPALQRLPPGPRFHVERGAVTRLI